MNQAQDEAFGGLVVIVMMWLGFFLPLILLTWTFSPKDFEPAAVCMTLPCVVLGVVFVIAFLCASRSGNEDA